LLTKQEISFGYLFVHLKLNLLVFELQELETFAFTGMLTIVYKMLERRWQCTKVRL